MRRTSLLGLIGAFIILAFAIGCSGGEVTAKADETKPSDTTPVTETPKVDFASVKTGIDSFCMPCHDATNKQGGIDMTAFKSEADIDKAAFAKMASEVESKKMPPATAAKQPSDDERTAMVAGLKALGQ